MQSFLHQTSHHQPQISKGSQERNKLINKQKALQQIKGNEEGIKQCRSEHLLWFVLPTGMCDSGGGRQPDVAGCGDLIWHGKWCLGAREAEILGHQFLRKGSKYSVFLNMVQFFSVTVLVFLLGYLWETDGLRILLPLLLQALKFGSLSKARGLGGKDCLCIIIFLLIFLYLEFVHLIFIMLFSSMKSSYIKCLSVCVREGKGKS